MFRRQLAVAVVWTFFFAGCTTPPQTAEIAAPGVIGINVIVPQALRENVALGDVTGWQELNPLNPPRLGGTDFAKALESSLQRASLLQPDREAARYVLSAKLVKLDQPLAGFSMSVALSVMYALTESPTGRTVWQKTLTTAYTAAAGEAYGGDERRRLASQGAARANLSEMLSELYRVRL